MRRPPGAEFRNTEPWAYGRRVLEDEDIGKRPEKRTDPDFEHLVHSFALGGAPLTHFEKAMARSQWEAGKALAMSLPSLSREVDL
jgi:hypothetical protein